MKTQKFYSITLHFENFDYKLDRGLIEEIINVRFLSDHTGSGYKGQELANYFYDNYPHIYNIFLYRVKGRVMEGERELSTSEFLVSKVY